MKYMLIGKSGTTWISSWLYIGSNGIWCFFIIAVYAKYGHVKMGKADDKPEFGDASYCPVLAFVKCRFNLLNQHYSACSIGITEAGAVLHDDLLCGGWDWTHILWRF